MSFLADRSAVSIGLGGIPSLRSGTGGLNPSLDLNFAVSKSLDPRITFTRASEARYYDASTVALAEQNLLTYSQQFDNAVWVKNDATVSANAIVSPDGTVNAEKLVEGTANSLHFLHYVTTLASSTSYTLSVFAKAGERTRFQIAGSGSSWASYSNATFDLSAGTVVANTGAFTSASITSVGNGWYRCTVTGLSNAISTSQQAVQFLLVQSGTTVTYTGDGTSGIYVWGAQLEQRSTVTAYTPTTTAAITNYIPVLQVAANGVARFDHNPVTRESLGLLIEEQRTNLLTYSEQFDNAAWTKLASSVSANANVSPDGTVDAEKLIEDTTAAYHGATFTFSWVSGTTYTASVFVKAAGRGFFQIAFPGSQFSNAYANFDVSTGALGSSNSVTATIASVGNGWYRCTATATATASAATSIGFGSQTSGTATRFATYTGDGFSGIYIWGAQLEAGAFATSYIPTVASQVTRSADAASMTGTNFSSWYRQDEGTIYTEATTSAPNANTPHVYDVSDGTTSNFISSLYAAIDHFDVKTGGTYQCMIDAGTVTQGVQAKVCGTYRVNDFAACIGGAAVVADTSGVIPVVTNIRIGARNDGAFNFNGTIKRLVYYPVRLANATLQSLTA